MQLRDGVKVVVADGTRMSILAKISAQQDSYL